MERTKELYARLLPELPVPILLPGEGGVTARGHWADTGGINKHKQSRPILTRYERASIVGMRMEQLQRGAEPFVTVDEKDTGVRDIAIRELEERKLPFLVARKLPDGKKDVVSVKELLG